MKYRAAVVDDCETLHQFIVQLDSQHIKYGRPSQAATNIMMLDYAIDNGQYNPVAVVDDKVVGWSGYVVLPGSPAGEVVAIGTYVDSQYRKQNVSANLRQLAFDVYRSLGYTVITGSVHIDNQPGLKSAIAAGYTPVGYIVQLSLVSSVSSSDSIALDACLYSGDC